MMPQIKDLIKPFIVKLLKQQNDSLQILEYGYYESDNSQIILKSIQCVNMQYSELVYVLIQKDNGLRILHTTRTYFQDKYLEDKIQSLQRKKVIL